MMKPEAKPPIATSEPPRLAAPPETGRSLAMAPLLAFGASPERGCPQPQHASKRLGLGTFGQCWLVGIAAAGDSRAPPQTRLARASGTPGAFTRSPGPSAGLSFRTAGGSRREPAPPAHAGLAWF